MIGPPFYNETDGKFVEWPANVGLVPGGLVGAVVGIPMSLVGGCVATTMMDEELIDGMKVGFFGSVIVFAYIGNAIVGTPFWATKKVFYDVPKDLIVNKEKVEHGPKN